MAQNGSDNMIQIYLFSINNIDEFFSYNWILKKALTATMHVSFI